MNLKLNLKVLREIQEDLARVEAQLPARIRNQELQAKYREQVQVLRSSADKLFEHYKIILESQK